MRGIVERCAGERVPGGYPARRAAGTAGATGERECDERTR